MFSHTFFSTHSLGFLVAVFFLWLIVMIIADIFWFIFGRKVILFFYQRSRGGLKLKAEKTFKRLEKVTDRRLCQTLLFMKFLTGVKILMIIYLSMREMRFATFLLFNTLGSAIWLITIFVLGGLAARSMIGVAPQLDKLGYLLVFLIGTAIMVKYACKYLSKKVTLDE